MAIVMEVTVTAKMTMTERKHKRSGLALLLVLVLVVAATALAMGYVSRATVQLASSGNLVKSEQARYLAESAMEHAVYLLRHEPSVLDVTDGAAPGVFPIGQSGDAYYFGAAGVDGKPGQFLLSGNGVASGITQSITSRWFVYSEYLAAALAMNPTHYWRLGELNGATAYDVEEDRNGTYYGPVLGREGGIIQDANPSVQFDGINDYVDLGDLDLEGSAMTIAAWVYADRHDHLSGHDARIISKADGTATNDHWWMLGTRRHNEVTKLRFRLQTNETSGTREMTAGNVPVGQWVFAVATYDGTHMRIYQDGVQVGIRGQDGDIEEDSDVSAWIGGNPSGSTHRPWCGRIDEVAIYNYALSPGQILMLYKAKIPQAKILAWNE